MGIAVTDILVALAVAVVVKLALGAPVHLGKEMLAGMDLIVAAQTVWVPAVVAVVLVPQGE